MKLPRNYDWSIILTLFATGSVCLAFWLQGGGAAFLTEIAVLFGGSLAIPFLLGILILCAYLISNSISGASYLGKALDFFTGEQTLLHLLKRGFFKLWRFVSAQPEFKYSKLAAIPDRNENSRKQRAEGILTTFGVILGFSLGISFLVLGCPIPMALLPMGYGAALLVIGFQGAYGGLFARIGRVIDRFRNSKNFRNYEIFVGLALLLGIVLNGIILATYGLAVFHAPVAMPALCAGALFISLTTGSLVSGASYLGRVFDFVLGNQQNLFSPFAAQLYRWLTKVTGNKKWEMLIEKPSKPFAARVNNTNLLTTVGVLLGFITGGMLLAYGVTMCSIFPVGLPLIIGSVPFLMGPVGVLGGLFNRIGQMLDHQTDKRTLFHALGLIKTPPKKQHLSKHSGNQGYVLKNLKEEATKDAEQSDLPPVHRPLFSKASKDGKQTLRSLSAINSTAQVLSAISIPQPRCLPTGISRN